VVLYRTLADWCRSVGINIIYISWLMFIVIPICSMVLSALKKQVSKNVDFEVLRGHANALLAAKKPDEVCHMSSGLPIEIRMISLFIIF